MSEVRRVAIIGAECVGKSELALRLARVLPGLAIAEYLREFCDRMRRTPLPQEQARILAEQRRREDEAVASAQAQGFGWVLADSAPLVTAAYSEFLFADHSLHDGALAHHAHYHATLLLAPASATSACSPPRGRCSLYNPHRTLGVPHKSAAPSGRGGSSRRSCRGERVRKTLGT